MRQILLTVTIALTIISCNNGENKRNSSKMKDSSTKSNGVTEQIPSNNSGNSANGQTNSSSAPVGTSPSMDTLKSAKPSGNTDSLRIKQPK